MKQPPTEPGWRIYVYLRGFFASAKYKSDMGILASGFLRLPQHLLQTGNGGCLGKHGVQVSHAEPFRIALNNGESSCMQEFRTVEVGFGVGCSVKSAG